MHASNMGHQANAQVLATAYEHALIYGRCGLRFLSKKEGLQMFPANRYMVVYTESEFPGAYRVTGYVLPRRPDVGVPAMFWNLTPGVNGGQATNDPWTQSTTRTNTTIIDPGSFSGANTQFWVDFDTKQGVNDNFVFCLPDQFENFYLYGSEFRLDTPLMHDLDRIELFVALMKRLREAVDCSTSQVILVKLAEDLFNMNTKQISELLPASDSSKEQAIGETSQQLRAFAKQVSTGTNRETLVVPPAMDELTQIEPAEATSTFLTLHEKAEEFVTRLYGLSQNVLNFQKLPRDASSSPIFEQMFKTSVYPKRQIVSQMLSRFLGEKLGVGRVSFSAEEFTLTQHTAQAQAIANVMSTLNKLENPNPEFLAKIESLLA